MFVCMYVCVCVCEREREREREMSVSLKGAKVSFCAKTNIEWQENER